MSALEKRKSEPVSGKYTELLSAAGAYYTRLVVKRALARIEIQLPFNGDYTVYCGEAAAVIVLSIEMDAGVDLEDRSRDEALNSIFFMLVLANLLSDMFRVDYEKAALVGANEFVYYYEDAPVYLKKVMTIFSDVVGHTGVIKSIEDVMSCWLWKPDEEYYKTLVEMYKSTAKFVKY